MTKLSRRLRTSCAARKKADSDRFRGWADSGGDDEMTRGGDWFNKGTDFSAFN